MNRPTKMEKWSKQACKQRANYARQLSRCFGRKLQVLDNWLRQRRSEIIVGELWDSWLSIGPVGAVVARHSLALPTPSDDVGCWHDSSATVNSACGWRQPTDSRSLRPDGPILMKFGGLIQSNIPLKSVDRPWEPGLRVGLYQILYLYSIWSEL